VGGVLKRSVLTRNRVDLQRLAAGALAWLALVVANGPARADATFGPELEGFAYPYPLAHYRFVSQRQPLQMA